MVRHVVHWRGNWHRWSWLCFSFGGSNILGSNIFGHILKRTAKGRNLTFEFRQGAFVFQLPVFKELSEISCPDPGRDGENWDRQHCQPNKHKDAFHAYTRSEKRIALDSRTFRTRILAFFWGLFFDSYS
jgi:hypothetical protein